MRILFCSEGFIIDGVASYNLYLSAALQEAGYTVAIIGRWAACAGFQKRHRLAGVKVIQCPSPTVSNTWLLLQAVRFMPEIIITDARRAFPFAREVRRRTGAKVVTIFHDPAVKRDKPGRDLASLIVGSDAWVTPEHNIFVELCKLKPKLPLYHFQRPVTSLIRSPLPMPDKKPFRVLGFGRLSRWKSPGLWAVVDNAVALKQAIPSLEITVVGGGWRRITFAALAHRANAAAGCRFVRIVGAQTDPQKWIRQASVVCAGATSAAEAILYGRPVVAFSGFWHGLVTLNNIERGIATHFGERGGCTLLNDNPHLVCQALLAVYRDWHQLEVEARINRLRRMLRPHFDAVAVTDRYASLFSALKNRKVNEPAVGEHLPAFGATAVRT